MISVHRFKLHVCVNAENSIWEVLNGLYLKNNLICPNQPGFEDALSGLRQFLASESHLKMMKNAFYFTLKPLLVLKIKLHFCLDVLVL